MGQTSTTSIINKASYEAAGGEFEVMYMPKHLQQYQLFAAGNNRMAQLGFPLEKKENESYSAALTLVTALDCKVYTNPILIFTRGWFIVVLAEYDLLVYLCCVEKWESKFY